MRQIVPIAAILVTAFAISSLALAQVAPSQEPPAAAALSRADKNGDGVISKDEWEGRAEVFDKIDTNRDGKLDTVEIAAARGQARQIRERAQERRSDQRGPAERRTDGRGPGERRPEESPEADRIRQRVYGAAMFAAELFKMIDADNDARLSNAEIDAFAAKIKEADADKDGFVTRQEAREYVKKRLARRIGDAFMKKFDTNADGSVSRDEFKGNDKRFQWLDANKDGVITIEDFEQRGPNAFERGSGEGKGSQRGRGEGRDRVGPRGDAGEGTGRGPRGGGGEGAGRGPRGGGMGGPVGSE